MKEKQIKEKPKDTPDHSAENDLGPNPYIIRCPFDPPYDVNKKKFKR